MNDFLGLKSSAELMAEIAERCDFASMKRDKDVLENLSEWKDGQPGMYRKGGLRT